MALTAAAAATQRLQLGTGICLVIERDPIITAKEIATLDRLSGGRFLFGIGGGWNAEEMENHGTELQDALAALRERVLAMKADLDAGARRSSTASSSTSTRSGRIPKPVQKPHPPIFIGGDAPRRSIASWSSATAGCRSCAGTRTLWTGSPRSASISSAPDAIPKSVPVSIFFAPPKPPALEALAKAGVERAIFGLPSEPRDAMLPRLDAYAAAMRAR